MNTEIKLTASKNDWKSCHFCVKWDCQWPCGPLNDLLTRRWINSTVNDKRKLLRNEVHYEKMSHLLRLQRVDVDVVKKRFFAVEQSDTVLIKAGKRLPQIFMCIDEPAGRKATSWEHFTEVLRVPIQWPINGFIPKKWQVTTLKWMYFVAIRILPNSLLVPTRLLWLHGNENQIWIFFSDCALSSCFLMNDNSLWASVVFKWSLLRNSTRRCLTLGIATSAYQKSSSVIWMEIMSSKTIQLLYWAIKLKESNLCRYDIAAWGLHLIDLLNFIIAVT